MTMSLSNKNLTSSMNSQKQFYSPFAFEKKVLSQEVDNFKKIFLNFTLIAAVSGSEKAESP